MTKVLRFPCYFARITNLKFFTYLHFCFLENILGNLSFIQHHVRRRTRSKMPSLSAISQVWDLSSHMSGV